MIHCFSQRHTVPSQSRSFILCVLNISIIFSRICWQTGDPRPIFAPKGLDLSWMLLLYQIIITITCWHQLFQNTSLFNQFTSLLALNCSCPSFFWNVLQVWMTGKDVYLQMTWSWPDKTWNIYWNHIVCNEIQVNFLFAFSILSQHFLIWGCIKWIKYCRYSAPHSTSQSRTCCVTDTVGIQRHTVPSQSRTCCVTDTVGIQRHTVHLNQEPAV